MSSLEHFTKNIWKVVLLIIVVILCLPVAGIIIDVVINLGRYVGSFARMISEGNVCLF